jgi:hypothetical protein
MNKKKKLGEENRKISLKQKRALVQYQVQKIDYYDSRATAKQK